MWGDVRRRAWAGRAFVAILAVGIAAPAAAADPPASPPPPRAGIAAEPAPPVVQKAVPPVGPKAVPKVPAIPGSKPVPAAAPETRNDAPNPAPPAEAAAPKTITVHGDRLTVQVSDVPLDEVLHRIAESSKAEIRGAVASPRNVTADFADSPLRDGLTRLLGEQNFLLTYRDDGRLRRLTLLGGPVAAPAEARVVKASPEPPPQPASPPGDVLQRRVPVGGKLRLFLGEDSATLQQLIDIALRQDDAGLRLEAVTSGFNAMDAQPDLRAAAVQSLEGTDDQVLEGLLRSMAPDRAMEILTNMTGSRVPEFRARGTALSRRMRDHGAQAVAP